MAVARASVADISSDLKAWPSARPGSCNVCESPETHGDTRGSRSERETQYRRTSVRKKEEDKKD